MYVCVCLYKEKSKNLFVQIFIILRRQQQQQIKLFNVCCYISHFVNDVIHIENYMFDT